MDEQDCFCEMKFPTELASIMVWKTLCFLSSDFEGARRFFCWCRSLVASAWPDIADDWGQPFQAMYEDQAFFSALSFFSWSRSLAALS